MFLEGVVWVKKRFSEDPRVAFAKIEIGKFDGNVETIDGLENS